ncbi:hypothetical protein GH714_002774 [Hevea brasiliensis]|uniref:Uncharacterized protein n=1 Tax=Hevea brasiliensis TaxID=3981 RepID=A0A6A6KPZ9_HEVBR|nr:hypothetical protein GH714_002774 [Hevea brasiliensis]
MSVTLRDVAALNGLPIHGEALPALAIDMASTQPTGNFGTSFINFISLNARKDDIIDEEHVLFLWGLIRKFIFCPSLSTPSLELLPIAKALADGIPLNLSEMLLGHLYSSLGSLIRDNATSGYVQAIPYLPILLPGGLAFAERMRWISADDIRHTTNEIQRALKHFFAHDMPAGALSLELSTFEKAKLTVTPFGVKIHMPQSFAKVTIPPQRYLRITWHPPLELCSLSETIDITGCDSLEYTTQGPSDISVVKPPIAPTSSDFGLSQARITV